MVKFRKASKAGVTARYIGEKFNVSHDGITERVDAPELAGMDIESALREILNRF